MNWFKKLTGGLNKTANNIKGSINSIFKGKKIDATQLADLEEKLILSDIGLETSESLVSDLKNIKISTEPLQNEVLNHLASGISKVLVPVEKNLEINKSNRPHVIILAGVNGSGKTTTAGKLAHQFKEEGQKVLLAACDTFRAAATEQLLIWGERSNVEVLKTDPGGDAAALAFQALVYAQEKNFDVLIVDTAGRLQVKEELMQELQKIVRVLDKKYQGSPHERIIVLDGATGQNAHSQVSEFSKAIDVSGLIITKLDGTAKGGVVVALAKKFGIPIHAVGVGEGIDDLTPFVAEDYSRAILGIEKT
mgnify:CR=1 FL=1